MEMRWDRLIAPHCPLTPSDNYYYGYQSSDAVPTMSSSTLPSSDTGKQSLFVVFGLQEFGDFGLAYYLPSNHTDVRSFESFAFESYQGFTTYDDTQQIQADGFKPVVFDPAEHLLPEAPTSCKYT